MMSYCTRAGLPEHFYTKMGAGFALVFEKEKGAADFSYASEIGKTTQETTQETAGNFRWDLYYRMAVTELQLPKLASRGLEEIDEMFEYFLNEIHKRHPGKKRLKANSDVILHNFTF